MAIDSQFYKDKLQKLQTKANVNLQKFINAAFDMVNESRDLDERMAEIQNLLKAEPTETPAETK